jgi:dolichyl-phosphate beta-glucosyltransferase
MLKSLKILYSGRKRKKWRKNFPETSPALEDNWPCAFQPVTIKLVFIQIGKSGMINNKRISVVLPCFNEERSIYDNIKKIFGYLKKNSGNFEIIAVNDGSTDGTMAELKKIQNEIPLTVINNPTNEGKGNAVIDGVSKSTGDIIMFLDADLAVPIEELEKFIIEIDNGYDMAIASRFVPGGRVIKKVLWYRAIMEEAFRFIRTVIINNYKIKDTQCGFKVFKREAAMKIFPLMTIKRFAFDAEIVFIASKLKYKIKELPIALQNPIRSHIRIIRDPLNMFFDLLRIRIRGLKKTYEIKK